MNKEPDALYKVSGSLFVLVTLLNFKIGIV